ncbi:MAG: type II secretion system GspH family protein [Puniceicoccales bacterium]|jgi:prepilin-type N-terminal cleavage/methylation domain-containing protein|nr:type II secretion system GspH family protein [Puniceicoccales bacterium]
MLGTVRWDKRNKAFTLVELLTVVSVIVILAAILMPLVGNAINDAKKLRALKNLQQIATAYVSFSLKDRFGELNSCKNAAEWAGVLSRHEELNIASIFIFNDDYLVESNRRTVPKTIGIRKNGKWHINPDFENFPMSVVVISGIASRSPAATTPIAYSRGLDPQSGQWRSASGDDGGIYGESGGIIVFLDGHAEFYPNLTDPANMLVNYYTGEKTSKISEAVNTGARALSWTGVEWEAGNKEH